MNRAIGQAVVRAFRRAAPPLAWYYAVTLVLPLANGAAQAGAAFVDHALVVLVLPPVLIVLACATREIARALGLGSSLSLALEINHPVFDPRLAAIQKAARRRSVGPGMLPQPSRTLVARSVPGPSPQEPSGRGN